MQTVTIVEVVSVLRIAVFVAFTIVAVSVWSARSGLRRRWPAVTAAATCAIACLADIVYLREIFTNVEGLALVNIQFTEDTRAVLRRSWASNAFFALGFSLLTGLSGVLVGEATSGQHLQRKLRAAVAGMSTAAIGAAIGSLYLIVLHTSYGVHLLGNDQWSQRPLELIRDSDTTLRFVVRVGLMALLGVMWTRLHARLRAAPELAS